MNENRIVTTRFSNPDSARRYREHWPDETELRLQAEEGGQCGGCAFFAPFNSDWGLCCNPKSKHVTETVFEHFTCAALVAEDWGSHSFTEFRLDDLPGATDIDIDPRAAS